MAAPPSRRLLLALGLLVVVAIVVRSGLLDLAGRVVLAPVTAWQASLVVQGTVPVSLDDRARELIARLNAENAALRRRLRDYTELEAAGLADQGRRFLYTRIVARSREAGRHFLHLGRGATDGIRRGLAVLAGASLVGVVRGEDAGRSLVQLCTDVESRVPAVLLSPPATAGAVPVGGTWIADGTLAGTGAVDRLELLHVEARPGLVVSRGMQVVTAGLDPELPPGLVLGMVVLAEPQAHSDQWRIDVEPYRPWGSYAAVNVLRD